jgi:1-acyl-sn-glycerol-3-phosphate acyltransferase
MQEHPLLWKCLRPPIRLITDAAFDLQVFGTENIPKQGGVLIVSNHQSVLDPVVLAVHLARPVSYIAKSELFEISPIISWALRSMGGFPVHQGAADVGALKESIRRLDEGHILNLFPEGARTPDGEIGRMERGVALIERRAKVPIVPAAITGAFEAWPITRGYPRRWPIRVQFGPPMLLAHLKPEAIIATIDQTLRRMYRELRERFPSSPTPAHENGAKA